MNTTVFKYELPIVTGVDVEMPIGAEVLWVAAQGTLPYIWARIDPSAPIAPRRFYVYGTGYQIAADLPQRHIGSFMLFGGAFVGHVFEDAL